MKVILHIGMGKAGSSSIQNFFTVNREILRSKKILYPFDIVGGNRLGGDNHKCLAAISFGYNKNNVVFKQQKVFSLNDFSNFQKKVCEAYKQQLACSSDADYLVLSAEHFWSMLNTKEKVSSLKSELENLDIYVEKIIFYIREQVSWVKSITLQKIVEGSNKKLECPFDMNFLLTRLNYAETARLWSEIFDEAEFLPRIFNKTDMINGDLIDDFFEVSTIGKRSREGLLGENINVSSMKLEGYSLLALLNSYIAGSSNKGFNSSERKKLLGFLFSEYKGKPKDFFEQSYVDSIHEAFFQSNNDVRRKFFSDRKVLFKSLRSDYVGELSVLNDKNTAECILKLINKCSNIS